MFVISSGTSLTLDPMDTQVGLVALAPAGRAICWVSFEASSNTPVRAAVVVKNKVSNLSEPTGKCFYFIIYTFIVNVPLISPRFLFFLDFWVLPHFRPSEILRFATLMDCGSARPPMPSDGCRSPIYPTINPYRVSGRNMVSFGGLSV